MTNNQRLAKMAEQCAEVANEGWTQKHYHTGDYSARCSIGTIHYVAGISHLDSWALQDALAKVIEPEAKETHKTIVKWNDAPERKQSDVIDVFKTVAKNFHNGE